MNYEIRKQAGRADVRARILGGDFFSSKTLWPASRTV